MSIEIKIGNNIRLPIYFMLFFFLIKPDYFSFMGRLTTLYNIGFVVAFFVCVLIVVSTRILSKTALIVAAVISFPLLVSILSGVRIETSIILPFLQTLGILLLLDFGIRDDFPKCLNELALLLEIYTYVNLLSILIFQGGLYNSEFYSGNYWFLGYKNVMVRVLLHAICLNGINSIYKYKKHTVRLYCLMAAGLATLWIVDNKTGFIGLAFMVLMMLLFVRRELPKGFNVRNFMILFFALSVFLGMSSVLTSFEGVLEALGETTSVESRQLVWYRAVQLFIENPLWGYGLRTNEGYRQLINLSTGWGYFSHPHNYILYTLMQGGLIEIGLIVGLFVRMSRIYMNNGNNYGSKGLMIMYGAFFLMGIAESLTGAVLLYPLAILIEAFSDDLFDENNLENTTLE